MNLFLNGVAADASHPLNSFKRHSLTSEGLDLSNLSGGGGKHDDWTSSERRNHQRFLLNLHG